jgi:hypothetical protein
VDVLDRLLDLLRGGVLGVEARRLAEDCVIVKVFWPLSPRKFVFMRAAAIVPPSTTTASTSVTHEWRSVQRRIGR